MPSQLAPEPRGAATRDHADGARRRCTQPAAFGGIVCAGRMDALRQPVGPVAPVPAAAPVDGPAPQTFGALLRRHRLAAGLSQAALAERAGLSLRGVSDLERGARRTPQQATVRLLAGALGLRPEATAALEAVVARRRGPPGSAAARAVLPAVRHNLPVALTSFVGRERELAAVREAASSIARGSPSSRAQIRTTAGASSPVSRKLGATPPARWTKSATASYRERVSRSGRPASASGGGSASGATTPGRRLWRRWLPSRA